MAVVPLRDGTTDGGIDRCIDDLHEVGVTVATGILGPDQLERLRGMVDAAVEEDAGFLPPDRVDEEFGRVLFLPRYDERFVDLLDDERICRPCDAVLGSDSILYTMTTSCSPPSGTGRAMHRDQQQVTGDHALAMGVSILLDDFSEHTGSTRFLVGSGPDRPDDATFEAEAWRLEAPAGSVCWFDGRLWHDATANHSDAWRRCIILAVVRAYVRQRFDVARMLPDLDPDGLSPRVRQKLGLDVWAPGSYDEYYLPAPDRPAAILAAMKGGGPG